ncbi:MAG: TIR domain-containing protein [Alphaproteobacteria bacterium]|nr:TIR domain-containing protein [Alphaproteobacteria bacterium]MBU1549661.1 TIR domain-containing protein [Alphaproteobacteria bacterium]MBU2336516.1 TIR domain-containing protein [Alphaproteobacteria bacterium]MBU2387603.1 TIR domain-containing protein [Alphaproteobacteria bacterium]
MSISSVQSTIGRLQNQIADLRKKDAQEAKKEADAVSKANKAAIEAGKSKSLSTVQSKLRQAESAQKDAAATSKRRAAIAKELAGKSSDLMKAQLTLGKEEERARSKIAKDIEREQAGQLRRQKEINSRVLAGVAIGRATAAAPVPTPETFDVFICHASEDKEEFVENLANSAEAAGLNVFYDNKSIEWGENLRTRIDHGLANSRFGVVILSEAFFRKEWPKRELDGLFNLEVEGKSRILPIWHKISKDEILRNAPTLAGKLALTTAALTVDEIVDKLVQIVKGKKAG